MREAFKSLESLRLISVRPRVGAIVLQPSPHALINAEYLSASAHMQRTDALIEFRLVLELGLAALAAEKSTEQDWAAMRQALDDHVRALAADRVAHPADIAFHKAMAEASKNPIAILVLEAISETLSERSRRMNDVPGIPEEGLKEHWAIYRAIRQHNPEKARKAMRAHIQTAELNARIVQAIDTVQEQAVVHDHPA